MARKRSGSAVGNLLIGVLALGAWVISEYGVMFLILGALGLGAWIFYWLQSNRSEPIEPASIGDARDSRGLAQRESGRKARVLPRLRGDDAWVPSTKVAEVQGRRIGGLVYVGRGLAAAGGGIEPALINPSLPVSGGPADVSLRQTNYWPDYAEISPDARNAYLRWLAAGRDDPSADIGYVFLYFYGLERRALLDAESSEAAKAELPAIEGEVSRLLEIYGRSGSVRRYLGSFLDLLRTRLAPPRLFAGPPPPLRGDDLTFLHRLGLAQCADAGEPLPADWAYLWYVADPSTRLRSAAKRCPREFEALFKERYAQKYGSGMTLPKNRTRLQLDYTPASRGFGHGERFQVGLELPDVTVLTSPVKKLQAIAEDCYDTLAAYSRTVGSDGAKAGSLEALAELPISLWPEIQVRSVKAIRETVAAARNPVPFPMATVLSWLPFSGDLTRPTARALSRALGQAGLGVEPDIGMGSGLPALDSTVYVFPIDGDAMSKRSSRYSAAALTMRLAVAVAAADGETTDKERSLLARQLEDWLHLDEGERQRLHALLRHLSDEAPKLTGLKKSIAVLDAKARDAMGDFLIRVAQSDTDVTAPEIKMLEKIFSMLGLEVGTVYARLHLAATEPITVREGSAIPGRTIPPKPLSQRPSITLDPARVAALQADSERVSAILGSIFDVPVEPPEPIVVDREETPQAPGLMGLDPAHAAFLQALLARPQWTRADLEELAADREMMIDGTLERINEASFDRYEKPILEGEDVVELNQEVVRELLQ